jgi:RHS repeat-associated protein
VETSYYVRSGALDGTGAATAAYDALGQRVRTASGGRERIYVYDIAGKVVAEYGPPGGDSGGTSYLFTDHQGSTRAVLDARGRVKARRDYGPFGGEVGAGVGPRTGAGTGGQLYGSLDGTRRQYALTERDAETGLDHAWWRKYDSLAGRWTSPDPYLGSASLGDPQSFNRYTYVGNDPVNFIDPEGSMKLGNPHHRTIPSLYWRFLFFTPGGGGTGGGEGGGGPQNPALADRAAKNADKKKEMADCYRRSWEAHRSRVLNKFVGWAGYAAPLHGADKIPEDVAESLAEVGIVIGAVGGDSVVRRGTGLTIAVRGVGTRVGTGRTFAGALIVNRTRGGSRGSEPSLTTPTSGQVTAARRPARALWIAANSAASITCWWRDAASRSRRP